MDELLTAYEASKGLKPLAPKVLITWPASNPKHTCTKFVTFSTAANAAGVPYQYVFGLAKRSRTGKNSPVTVRNDGKWKICEDCAKAFYGPSADEGEELRTEPIRAYRTFTVENGMLCSWHDSDFVWGPQGVRALCRSCSTIPGRRHRCGLYAVAEPDDPQLHPQLHGYGSIRAAVELWGRYVAGDGGWRAEWGKPVSLLCDNWTFADENHDIAARYNISVVHSVAALKNSWYNLETSLRKEDNGHRNGEEDGGSAATSGARVRPGTATCREAARACRTFDELRYLVTEGIISQSNVLELMRQ